MESNLEPSTLTIQVRHASKIILTPPQHSDGPAVLLALNDPRVYTKLNGPPYPYQEKDWEEWYPTISNASASALEDFKVAQEERTRYGSATKGVGRTMWPFSIRQVTQPNNSGGEEQRWIGEISIQRGSFLYIVEEDEREKRKEQNDSLEPGDPRIIWEIGFYLIPEYHGRGIMPAVLQTLMHRLFVPYMNAKTIRATYFEYNSASRRVFEKCGFHFLMFVPDAITLSKTKTGDHTPRKLGLGVMEWTQDT
ncbi:uncharacterized protein Z518_02722 [Rhinocladiella mackenziei CBS 650.93]|uniref:N-acetyltransferase domain-containing protein n=1 Tax=Rhinocladiella mackenziei CBS 650.93 TaxID=1442369 RepID=A0A0D2G0P1_9EURO|nr:uncharacterized protein Z518_02722 [Rhinocladiella mackenziei CBS 650.93]KIX08067.1 hypothetical protein Z518_02722 [Rhinocladiella mackenziei CBS 650.93]